MNNKQQKLSSIERRPAHVSLTHFFKRNWEREPGRLISILSKCSVEPYLGALPPELRNRVSRQDLSDITYKFRMRLENFLVARSDDVIGAANDITYSLDDIGELFGTRCQLLARGVNYAGICPWQGGFGTVCKLSFPEIGAEYALKIYNFFQEPGQGHGAMWEIPTAFAATHAEPRDNSRVYMASLTAGPYLLSKWEGDYCSKLETGRFNQNEIFVTSPSENRPRNYRNGRRIDYGDTRRTAYGAASWRVRKMCRKIQYVIRDSMQIREIVKSALGNPRQRRELDEVAEVLYDIAPVYFMKLQKIVIQEKQRLR